MVMLYEWLVVNSPTSEPWDAALENIWIRGYSGS